MNLQQNQPTSRREPETQLHFSYSQLSTYLMCPMKYANNYVYGEYDPSDQAPVMQDITWQSSVIGLKGKYEFLNNAYVFAGIFIGDVKGHDVDGVTAEEYLAMFGPEMYWGKTSTINIGFNFGF